MALNVFRGANESSGCHTPEKYLVQQKAHPVCEAVAYGVLRGRGDTGGWVFWSPSARRGADGMFAGRMNDRSTVYRDVAEGSEVIHIIL